MKTLKKGLMLLFTALFMATGAYAQKSIAQNGEGVSKGTLFGFVGCSL